MEIVSENKLLSSATPIKGSKSQASFRAEGEPLGVFDDILPFRHDKIGKEVWLSKGPTIWLRVMSAEKPDRTFEIEKLRRMANGYPLLMPLGFDLIHGDIFHIRAEDGYGSYASVGNIAPQIEDVYNPQARPKNVHIDDKILTADLLSFIFSTGEFWGIDAHSLRILAGSGIPPIIEKYMRRALAGYVFFLKRLGINPPYRWMAGLEGIEGEALRVPFIPYSFYAHSEGIGKCEVNSITAEGEFKNKSPAKVLAPLFRQLYESCNVGRPQWLDDD